MSSVFPSHEDGVTAPLLSDVLGRRSPGTRVEGVEVRSVKRCGEGIASTADRMVLGLRYGANPAGLPERMLLKTMLAAPHAPSVMFETEVRFYEEIRPELGVETPACYGSGFDAASGQFGLLLEDLTTRGARFPDATRPVAVTEVAALLRELARLHGRFWESPRFGTDLSWVATPHEGGMAALLDDFGHDLIVDQLERHPFKRELIEPLGVGFDRLWEAVQRSRDVLATAPPTLLHGDTHLGNTYLLPDGAGLLDWQLQVRGCWAHDVVYLIGTALPPRVRRQHQHRLVELYLDELGKAAPGRAPDADEAWLWCRRAVVWGLVIGWLICPPENYGEAVTVANIERMATAVADLDALGALGLGSTR